MADQLLSFTYCYRLYGLSSFSNGHAVLRKLLSVAAKTEIWNSCEYQYTLASGWFWRFSQKNSSFWLPYQRPSFSADCARELFNGSNGSANLVDCTRKKNFAWGVRVFCE